MNDVMATNCTTSADSLGNPTEGVGDGWQQMQCLADRYKLAVAEALLVYGPPMSFGIGLLGHTTAILVLSRLQKTLPSASLFLVVGLVVDFPVMYILSGNTFIKQLMNERWDVIDAARRHSEILCKVVPFISNTCLHLSIWLTVFTAIDSAIAQRTAIPRDASSNPPSAAATRRSTSSRDPARRHRFERTRAVVLLLVILLVCANAHCYWTYSFVPIDGNGVPQISRRSMVSGERICLGSGFVIGTAGGHGSGAGGGNGAGKQSEDIFRSMVWPILNLLLTHIGPLLIIIFSSVVSLSARCRRRSSLGRSAAANGQKPPRISVVDDEHHQSPSRPLNVATFAVTSFDNQLYCAVLFLSVYHVLFLSPDMFSQIALFVFPIFQQVRASATNPGDQTGDINERVISHRFLAVFSSFLFQAYFAGKAFVLIVSWPSFRRQLFALVTCRFRPQATMMGGHRMPTSRGSGSNNTATSIHETRASCALTTENDARRETGGNGDNGPSEMSAA